MQVPDGDSSPKRLISNENDCSSSTKSSYNPFALCGVTHEEKERKFTESRTDRKQKKLQIISATPFIPKTLEKMYITNLFSRAF